MKTPLQIINYDPKTIQQEIEALEAHNAAAEAAFEKRTRRVTMTRRIATPIAICACAVVFGIFFGIIAFPRIFDTWPFFGIDIVFCAIAILSMVARKLCVTVFDPPSEPALEPYTSAMQFHKLVSEKWLLAIDVHTSSNPCTITFTAENDEGKVFDEDILFQADRRTDISQLTLDVAGETLYIPYAKPELPDIRFANN